MNIFYILIHWLNKKLTTWLMPIKICTLFSWTFSWTGVSGSCPCIPFQRVHTRTWLPPLCRMVYFQIPLPRHRPDFWIQTCEPLTEKESHHYKGLRPKNNVKNNSKWFYINYYIQIYYEWTKVFKSKFSV